MFPRRIENQYGVAYIPYAPGLNLYRIKPRYAGRGTGSADGKSVPPATEALKDIRPNGELGNQIVFRLPWQWVEFLRAVNSPDSFRRLCIPWTGLFNAEGNPDWYSAGTNPMYNSVTFDWNVVNVLGIRGNTAYIEAIDIRDPLPAIVSLPNHQIHQFFSITPGLERRLLGAGYVAYCPIFTNVPCGLELSKLEKI